VEGAPNHNSVWEEISKLTNRDKLTGGLKEALSGADVLIGVSVGNCVSKDMIKSMSKDSIVFPLANPTPEISREDALEAGAFIVGTGVSNKPNQINNALVFPGLFKGALLGGAKSITTKMQVAACHALAKIVKTSELTSEYIIPNIFNKNVAKNISLAVIKAI
jgi:malate dehydrogenase (oxaloacetate-decarboxylating)